MTIISHLRHISFIALALAASLTSTAQEPDSAALRSQQVVQSLIAPNANHWSNVTVPVRLTLTTPRGPMAMSGRMTMVRDQSIFISLRFWGFEVGQVYITTDSVVAVMKRPDKVYVSEQLRHYLRGLTLDVNTCQDMVMGRIVGPNGHLLCPDDSITDTTAEFDNILGLWRLTTVPQHPSFSLSYEAVEDAEGRPLVSAVVVTPTGYASARCQYTRLKDTPLGPLATETSVAFDIKDMHCSVAVEMQWGKAKWDQASVPAFDINLGQYRRLDAVKLLTLIAGAQL